MELYPHRKPKDDKHAPGRQLQNDLKAQQGLHIAPPIETVFGCRRDFHCRGHYWPEPRYSNFAIRQASIIGHGLDIMVSHWNHKLDITPRARDNNALSKFELKTELHVKPRFGRLNISKPFDKK